jgi:exodeoxyribonuclease VII large subunit
VDRISDSGSGNIQAEFNKLRSKLEREGLFEPNRKRSLPRFPSNICLITSREGAVLKDIVKVISRRYPVVELHLIHASVQGTGSAEELCRSVQLANQLDFDIIILARGGGSPEDLTPFNDEKLARLIFSSRIPIVSAIGHETDYTISDYVADVRASTPSMAAEISVPSSEQLFAEINRYRQKLISEITESISDKTISYENTNDRLLLGSPQISNYDTSLKNISNKLLETLQTKIRAERHKVEILGKSLNLLDPFVSMSRGFVLTENLSGNIVRSIKDIKKGETMVVRYSDGTAKTKIIETDFPNEK